MAETRYTDAERPEPGTAEAVEAEFEVELAGLNDNETAQVREAISEAEFNNELDQLDVDAEIQQAQFAETDRAEAEELREDQVEAADRGDYETARDRAEDAQHELRDAAETHGGNLDTALSENARDVEVLSEAEFQQEAAESFEADAIDYAELDSDEGADASLDDAYDAADAADDAAQDSTDFADTGGDHSIYTDHG
ncbi:MAG: hypothetical protein AAGG11_23225 [Pseudomonadota bacterium]